jgi:hypothetical protein
MDYTVNVPCGRLVRATGENRDVIGEMIDDIIAAGTSNLAAGVKAGLELFPPLTARGESTYTASRSSGCSRAIVLLVDDTLREDESRNLDEGRTINGALDFPAVPFVYSISDSGNKVLQTKIGYTLTDFVCEMKGLFLQIDPETNLRNAMRGSALYYAVRSEQARPTWTEPYIDSFGAGLMTTVAKAVWAGNDGANRLLGVTGIDVLIPEIQKITEAAGLINLLEVFATQAPQCGIAYLDGCKLYALRRAMQKWSSTEEATCDFDMHRKCNEGQASCQYIEDILSRRCIDKTISFQEANCGSVCNSRSGPKNSSELEQFVWVHGFPAGQAGTPYEMDTPKIHGVFGSPSEDIIYRSIDALPPGLKLDQSGRLYGTPTTSGKYDQLTIMGVGIAFVDGEETPNEKAVMFDGSTKLSITIKPRPVFTVLNFRRKPARNPSSAADELHVDDPRRVLHKIYQVRVEYRFEAVDRNALEVQNFNGRVDDITFAIEGAPTSFYFNPLTAEFQGVQP